MNLKHPDRRRCLGSLLAAAWGLAGLSGLAAASSATAAPATPAWQPRRPITLWVPWAAGGATDLTLRLLAELAGQRLGQRIVIENRGGAGGTLAMPVLAQAAPDGYTLGVGAAGALSANVSLYPQMPFDPLKDFKVVTRGTQQPFVLVAHPAQPYSSLRELIEQAKVQPGKLSYGSSASGPQLAGELLKTHAGIDMLHVAYKGAGPAVIDVLAGHIPLLVANPTSVAPHVRSGKLKGIVLFGNEALDTVLPGVPTASQAGHPALGEMPEWYGFAVAAATPDGLVAQLNRDLVAVLADAGVQAKIRALGLVPSSSTPGEFAQQIQRDHQSAGRLVKLAGIEKQ